MYEIDRVYLGNLCVVTDEDDKEYYFYILKKGLFFKTDFSFKFEDLENKIVYDNTFYDGDSVGKIIVDKDSLKPIIQYFIENSIPYKKKMTKRQIMNAFCNDNIININYLFYGQLQKIIGEKDNDEFTYEVIRDGLFYYKELNDTFVDLEENIEYRNLSTFKDYSINISKGDLVVSSKEPLKEVLIKYNILYKNIMNKNEFNNLLIELDRKKKEENQNPEYTNGVNIDEYLTMKISVCGTTSELKEFLKNVNEELKPKVLQKKKIRKW